MKALAKYWKVILALALLIAAAVLYFRTYKNEQAAYETESQQLRTMITALESSIQDNMRYADVQDQLEAANAKVVASRLALYEHFPVDMLEEDQIMYILYLESLFGTEISFSFSTPQPITALRDGSTLMGLVLTVNYQTTYQGFQDMVNYLSTDSRVTSVQYASIDYDSATDTATGTVTLVLYLIDTDMKEYKSPYIPIPNIGKENIYD